MSAVTSRLLRFALRFAVSGLCPHWPLVTATALPPLLWLGARSRRASVLRRRRSLGLCPNCGYDLRGSRGSGRCSECGEAVPAVREGVVQ